MKKVFARLGVFFIGVPLIVFIIWLGFMNHIALHILICVMAGLAASELYNMLKLQTELLPKSLVISLSTALPLITGFDTVFADFTVKHGFHIGQQVSTYVFICAILVILGFEVFSAKDFKSSNLRLTSSSFIVLYCGYLFTFIQRMTLFKINEVSVSTIYIIVFIVMVFFCDSFAWFFGVTMGKNNKGFVRASPNKSIAGFTGGFFGSISCGVATWFIWPQFFEGSILKLILIGTCIAITSIIGDLAESVMKRSAGVKDSGDIIPGRGGVLDSIDSIVMSAPVFYLLTSILYKPF